MSIRDRFTARYQVRRVPVAGVEGAFLQTLSLRQLQEAVFPLVRDDKDLTVPLLALTLCDESGATLYAADDPELANLAGGELVELAKRAADLNGLSAKAEDDAKKN